MRFSRLLFSVLVFPVYLSFAPSLARAAAPSESKEFPVAEKVRLRQSGDSQVLEIIDPHSPNATWVQIGKVITYPAGSTFFHWGPASDIDYWISHGISDQDIHKAVRSPSPSDNMGGGFYISADALDSSNYGPKGLMAVAQHPVQVFKTSGDLNDFTTYFKFNHENRSIRDFQRKVDIPMSAIAEAGIDGVYYTVFQKWIVAIQGRPLHMLVEANAENLFKYRWKSQFNLREVIGFLAKSPPPAEFWQSSEFINSAPVLLRKIAQGVDPTREDVTPHAEAILEILRTLGFGHTLDLPAPLNTFWIQVYPYLKHDLARQLRLDGSSARDQNQFYKNLVRLGYNPEKILEETDDPPKKVELGLRFSCQKIHSVH
jgi:hypothetical protein